MTNLRHMMKQVTGAVSEMKYDLKSYQEELKELRREHKTLKVENEIIKKVLGNTKLRISRSEIEHKEQCQE